MFARRRAPRDGAAVVARGDINEINTLLAQARTHRDTLKTSAVNAEKKVKKAQTANAARQADDLIAAIVESGRIGSHLVESVEGPAALLQELLNGLKKVHFTHAAFLVVDDGDKLLQDISELLPEVIQQLELERSKAAA